MRRAWVALAIAAALPACVMSGYERAPLDHGVAPPSGGDGAGGASGDQARAGSGALAGSGEGRAGSSGAGGSAGTGAAGGAGGTPSAPVRDVCGSAPAGAACDDGRKCTQNDKCSGGYCVGTPMVCPLSLIDCSPIVCDETSGTCVNQARADGSSCGLNGAFRCIAGLCTRPQTCTTRECTADCEGDLSCLYQCPGSASCSAECAEKAACLFNCHNGDDCLQTCASNSFCRVDCSGSKHCDLSCESGARCLLDCRDATDCYGFMCYPGATCALTCSPGARCEFQLCADGEMSCGPNVIGCGGCPE